MSTPANISTQSKPSPTPQISQKSPWARGPPAGSAVTTPSNAISRSRPPNGTIPPSHPRNPSGLGPGSLAVPLQDGVPVPRDLVDSNKRPTSSVNFGSIDANRQNDTSRPPPKPFVGAPAPASAPQSAESAITPVVTPPASTTNSPTPSTSSITTSSSAPPKKKLDTHQMFHGTPQPASPSTSFVLNNISSVLPPSPQQLPAGLPPPAQHPHPSYYVQQPPHLRFASQSAAPGSSQLARTVPKGALQSPTHSTPNRNSPLPPAGVSQVGSPAMAHKQPPPSHYPPYQSPPAVQPPQMQVPMQQMQQQQQPWAPSYYYYEASDQGQPYWTPPHYRDHSSAPQMPRAQHPEHTGGMPASPLVGPIPVLPPSASPAINTTIISQPPPLRIPSRPPTARLPELKTTNSQGDAVVLIKDNNFGVNKTEKEKNRKSTPIRMESEEDRQRRLSSEAQARECAIEAEKKCVEEKALEKERLQIQKEEDDKRKAQDEIAWEKEGAEDEARRVKAAEKIEIKQKEDEARLMEEKEARILKARERREECLVVRARELELIAEWEEGERLLKAREDEERHLGTKVEAEDAVCLKPEAEEEVEEPTHDHPDAVTPILSLEILANSLASIEGQLATVLRAFGDTQNRLATVEKAVALTQADVVLGQKGVAELHIWLSAIQDSTDATKLQLSNFDHSVTEVAARTTSLSESFDQNRKHLEAIQGTVRGTQKALSGMGGTVDATRQLLLKLSDKVPTVETRLDFLATSLSKSDDRLLEVESAAGHAQESVFVVQQLMAAHSQIFSARNFSSPIAQKLGSQEAQDTLQQQVASLDEKVPTLEARAGKLERAFGQTLENLASVHSYLRTTQQQLTGLSGRVPVLEIKVAESLGQSRGELSAMRLSLASTEDRLSVITSRVIAVEDKAKKSADLLELVQGSLAGSKLFPHLDDEPTLFPPRGNHPLVSSSTVPSVAAQLPWLPLPKPLEDMF